MRPDRLEYLNKFDKFYEVLIDQAKTKAINEAEFYLVVGAKVKAMDRERREKMLMLNKKAK